MPCEREEKLQEDDRDLACRGLNLVPPGGASHLLYQDLNISELSLLLLPLLASQAPPYYEAIKWLQFYYTRDPKGGYTDPASAELSGFTFTDGEPIFTTVLRRLKRIYPGEYARVSTSTLGPPGHDYTMGAHND